MKSNKFKVSILTVIIGFTILSFIFGASYLETSFFGLIPIGNLLIPLGLISFPLLSKVLFTQNKVLGILNTLSLLVSISWLPIGVLLSGNLEMNFINDAHDSALFQKITYAIISGVLISFLASASFAFFQKHKTSTN